MYSPTLFNLMKQKDAINRFRLGEMEGWGILPPSPSSVCAISQETALRRLRGQLTQQQEQREELRKLALTEQESL
jgi:hypothetical protein